MALHLLIDADSLIYRAALKSIGIDEELEFKPMSPITCELNVYVAFMKFKRMLFDICMKIAEGRTMEELADGSKELGSVNLLMGSKDNFRKHITLKHRENVYKHNRINKIPPEGLYDLIEYILSLPDRSDGRHVNEGVFYTTTQHEFLEADDLMGIVAKGTNENMWLCYIDKDLKQIPHKNHFNYSSFEKYSVSPTEAKFHLLRQLIIGDSADNIAGIPRAGAKAADTMEAMSMGKPSSMLKQIIARYKTAFRNSWDEELAHNIRLLSVLRSYSEIEDALKPYIEPEIVINRFKSYIEGDNS